MSTRQYWIALLVYLGVCAIIAVGYAIRTPAWQNPDEPAHYNYIAQVAANGCCPVIEQGDWDQAYQDRLIGSRFAPALLDRLPAIQYEDHQPPLYYLIAAPVYALTGGALLPLRLLSVVFGAATCFVALQIGLLVFPQAQRGAAWRVLLLVGLVPQAAAMSAAINNDALAGLIVALSLWAMVRYLHEGEAGVIGGAWALGLLAGLGALTKVTILFLYLILPLAIVARWWIGSSLGAPAGTRAGPRDVRALLGALVRFAIPALALGGLWWARNLSVYGLPDFLGLRAHDAVVTGQPLAADAISRIGFGAHLATGIQTLFQSFWGQLGWMAYPFQPGIYPVILALVVFALIGLVVRGRPGRAPAARDADSADESSQAVRVNLRRVIWALMALIVIIAALQVVYYNLRFVQFQGRYLFPALIPIALALVLGLDSWGRLAVRAAMRGGLRDPRRLAWVNLLIGGLPIYVLIALDLYAILRILPTMQP